VRWGTEHVSNADQAPQQHRFGKLRYSYWQTVRDEGSVNPVIFIWLSSARPPGKGTGNRFPLHAIVLELSLLQGTSQISPKILKICKITGQILLRKYLVFFFSKFSPAPSWSLQGRRPWRLGRRCVYMGKMTTVYARRVAPRAGFIASSRCVLKFCGPLEAYSPLPWTS